MNNLLDLKVTNQLRGIAILLVILSHIGVLNNGGVWGVTIFLILSGFGLTLSYLQKGLDGFLTRKLSKVFVPYSLITMLWLSIDKFIYHKSYGIVKSLLAIAGLGFRSPVDGTMWYITYILIWYIIFYFVFRLSIKFEIKVVIMGGISIACYLVINKILPNTKVFGSYSFNFFIGIVIAIINKKINSIEYKTLKKYLLIILILSLATFYIFNFRIISSLDEISPIGLIGFGLVSIAAVSLLYMYKIKFRVLEFVGEISYELYLIEGVFLWQYNDIFNIFTNLYIKFAVYFVFIIILGYLIKKGFTKLSLILKRINFSTYKPPFRCYRWRHK